MWNFSVDTARQVLSTTTQYAVREVNGPLSRRLRTRQAIFRNRRFRGRVYTDTMFGITSMRGNKAAQLFVTDFGDVQIFGIKHKREAHLALSKYFRESGVPTSLHADGAPELKTSSKWKKVMEAEGGIKLSLIHI